MKQITEEQISEVITLINSRHVIEAKKILTNLEDVKENTKLRDKLKKIVREAGRSNMISKDKIINLLEEVNK